MSEILMRNLALPDEKLSGERTRLQLAVIDEYTKIITNLSIELNFSVENETYL